METSTTTVRPCPSTLDRTTKLSSIDQIAPRCYVASYFFFRLPAGVDNATVFRILEHGFHTTIEQIPDLMCCICRSDGARDELELRLHDDSGATITMKDFTSDGTNPEWIPATFDDLERDHFPLQGLPSTHVLAQTEFPGQECSPTLAMQANFVEGGLVLTGCLHHTVCDGTGNYLFYSILGQHISAATTGQDPNPLTDAAISFLERASVIYSEADDVKLDQFPDWKLVQNQNAFLNPSDYDPKRSPPVQFATYFISEDKLKALRKRAFGESGWQPSMTEAVCAFLWKHVVKARNADHLRYPETKLSITVNTRARMRHPVCSPAYWGNLSEPNAVARMPTQRLRGDVAAPTQPSVSHDPPAREKSDTDATLTDLATEIFEPNRKTPTVQHLPKPPIAGSSTKDTMSTDLAAEIFQPSRPPPFKSTPPLTVAALRIRQAIAAVDSTAVRRLVGLLNQMDKATSLTWNVDRWPGPDMLIVCLNQVKFNHIDFGPVLGFSEASRHTIGKPDGRPDGRCFLLPPRRRDGAGMEVCLQYDLETLERLGGDRDVREFFEWRN